MSLVKIDGMYINPDKVYRLCLEHIGDNSYGTRIYCSGAEYGFLVHGTLDEVAKIITEAME